jgi:mono/diheme cytochrome c family protein
MARGKKKTAYVFRPLLIMLGGGAALAAACLATAAPQQPAKAPLSYEKDILPLFRTKCLSCHGEFQPKTGFDIRTLGSVLQGGHSGPAVTPGVPEKSLLYKVLASGKMPPTPKKLSPAEIAKVSEWIKAGAKGQTAAVSHWAFTPPVYPDVPRVAKALNPVDSFLLSALQQKKLAFSPPADKRTLLRRVTFDLIGLPPTPQEMEAFQADTAPNAYEKVVDRLLADPRYGERWARHWLDTAGYADSEGILEEDKIRPNAWRYRDYVIRAFNNDKPYDQFLREQIAGDELVDYRSGEKWTPEVEEAITATGFLRTSVDATRDDFNTHQFTEYQYRMLNDTETILVSSTLGITLQCARCHDHKYEPFSQKDYYRVQAVLAGAIRPLGKLLPTNRRQIVAATTAQQDHAKKVNAAVDTAVQAIVEKEAALLADFRADYLQAKLADVPMADRDALIQTSHTEEAKRTPEQKALAVKHKALLTPTPEVLLKTYSEFKRMQAELQQAKAGEEKKRITFPEIRAIYDQDAAPPPNHLLLRGEWTKPGDVVEPGIPSVLDNPKHPFLITTAGKDAPSTGRRRALAEWITRTDNPLTARVIVNRIWSHHFGVGLVPSLENFGRSGMPPTNQPLLDWLACSLERGVNGGKPWTLKALQRLIVTSAAYRQASAYRPEAARVDPDDKLLWRQRSLRLEAEGIRDSILSISGSLDSTMYGDPVAEDIRGTGEVVPVGEEKGGRRSIYLLVRRSKPVTLLNTFDAPIMETNCTRRITSTTATQALALLNSSFMDVEARHFAHRVLEDKSHPAGQLQPKVVLAYQLALNRPPSQSEQAATLTFLREQTARYLVPGKPEPHAQERAFADFCLALLSSNELVYVD